MITVIKKSDLRYWGRDPIAILIKVDKASCVMTAKKIHQNVFTCIFIIKTIAFLFSPSISIIKDLLHIRTWFYG